MKILLIAINARYIHTNPAVYGLRGYAQTHGAAAQIQIMEFTTGDRYQDVLDKVLEQEPDAAAFSTYIWNTERAERLIRDLRAALGSRVQIWAGGPEASADPERFLLRDGADLCMIGEGEKSFTALASGGAAAENIPGLAFARDGEVIFTGPAEPAPLDEIPFLYENPDAFENRILYYEASRGCPFGCAYCLSGKERGVRRKSLARVKEELQIFLDREVPQVKFIDRTFNADPAFALEIWRYIRDHDRGITNFHFEIEADRMTEEELCLLEELRPGLIQMEIGVQSANEHTLRSVNRPPGLDGAARVMERLEPRQNINLHLDLIAGLPYEGMESFRHSFNTVYRMRPHQFQVGFLKLLRGTLLWDQRETYGLTASADPPYEVLRTRWLTPGDLRTLHRISDRVEEFVSSQGFRRSLPLAEALFEDPWALFHSLAAWYAKNGWEERKPSAQARYELFEAFLRSRLDELEESGSAPPQREQKRLMAAVRMDRLLHVHASRRMSCSETLDFGEGPVSIEVSYLKTNPVNGEAEFVLRSPREE